MNAYDGGGIVMNVQELMNQPVTTCLASDSLDQVVRTMAQHDCGAVPVVDAEGALAGIITDRDICMAANAHDCPLHAISVSTALTTKIVTCGPKDSVADVLDLMSQRQIRRIPVVDTDNRPIGMLSIADIARYAALPRRKGVLDREVTRTVAAICKPVIPPPWAEEDADQWHTSRWL
jgi:CBS domain-containing protein